jgi:RHS repeat-associated protein
MCITDPGSATAAGTQVTITACSSSASENWATFNGTGIRPLPGSTQTIAYTPQGLVSQVKSPIGVGTSTTSAEIVTYIYDASGRLLVEEDPGKVIYYGDGGAEELVYTISGTTATLASSLRFYPSPDGTTIVRSGGASPKVSYEVSTPQRSGIVAFDASGATASVRRYYDPYGTQLSSSGPWPDNTAFLGEVRNSQTGMDLLGARQYNPVTGAFLSLDPVLEAGSPVDMGGYTYASNSPVTTSDPTGLAGTPCASNLSNLSACESSAAGNGGGSSSPTCSGNNCYGAGLADAMLGVGGDIGGGSAPTSVTIAGVTLPASYPNIDKMLGTYYSYLPEYLKEFGEPSTPLNDLNAFAAMCGNGKFGNVGALCGMSLTLDLWEKTRASIVGAGAAAMFSDMAIEAGTAEVSALADEMTAASDAGQISKDFGCSLCGCSFSPGTKVILASGKAVPISTLKPGDKVLATNTSSGKTSPEVVTAVEVTRDTDLYDLRIKTAHGIAVIHTTASHLFWVPSLKKWVPAAKLSKGESLKAAHGTSAVVDGGATPRNHTAWMWDLTVPGDNDHDFYVGATSASHSRNSHTYDVVAGETPVLVHNASGPGCGDPLPTQTIGQIPPLTNSQAADLAKYLGFRATRFISRGQRVFTDGKWYISQDVDSHNGGIWKIARSVDDLGKKQTRTATTDALLNTIGG